MPTIRVPLAGSYTTRFGSSNVASSESGVVGVGVVGAMIVGRSGLSADKDQRFVNCHAVTTTNRVTGRRSVKTVKRPGFGVSITPQAGSIGTSIMVWSGQGSGGKVISAFGGTNSSIYDGETQLVTDNPVITGGTTVITGKATGITETQISGTATLLISSSDSTAWSYQDAGTVTKVSDSDFPGNASRTVVGTFAHLDGFAFIMDSTGRIYNGDLNSVTSWTATGYIEASAYPDKGVGIIRHRNTIMAFGAESTQFFANAGNAAGSPLARMDGATIRIGCVSAEAIGQIQDTVFWAGSSAQGGISIYAYSGELKRISTPEIDAQLVAAGTSNLSLTTCRFFGRSFVVVSASATTYVYCVEEDVWSEWSSQSPLWYRMAGVSAGSTIVNYAVSNKSTSGSVYVLSPTAPVWRDGEVAYTLRAQTAPLDLDLQARKQWQRIELIGDRQETTATTYVMWSDDDYQTFSAARTVDMSEMRPHLRRCGSARRRAWIVINETNTPWSTEAVEFDVEVSK